MAWRTPNRDPGLTDSRLLIFPLLLALFLLSGCGEDDSSPVDPPDSPWGWEDSLAWIDPDRPMELRAGHAFPDGHVLLAGEYLDGPGGGFLLRVQGDGELIWRTELTNTPASIAVANEGEARVSGTTLDGASWFASAGSDGSLSGLTVLANLQERAVAATPDGGTVFAAEKDGAIELLKFTATGLQRWVRAYEGELPHDVADLLVLEDGYLLAGSGEVGGADAGWLLIRTDADGHELWRRGYLNGQVHRLVMVDDSTVAMMGATTSPDSLDDLLFLDLDGNVLSQKPLDQFVGERSLHTDQSGELYAGGTAWRSGFLHRHPRVLQFTDRTYDATFDLPLQEWENNDEYLAAHLSCVSTFAGRLYAVGYGDGDGDGENEIWFKRVK